MNNPVTYESNERSLSFRININAGFERISRTLCFTKTSTNNSGRKLGRVINFVPATRRGSTQQFIPKIWKKGKNTGKTSWSSPARIIKLVNGAEHNLTTLNISIDIYSPIVSRHILPLVVSSTICILLTKFLCVNMTPFGSPVVPLENGKAAMSLTEISLLVIGGNVFPRVTRSCKRFVNVTRHFTRSEITRRPRDQSPSILLV